MTDPKVIPMPRRRPDADTLVNADWVAQRWGVHRDTVYRIPASVLPYVMLGPRTRRYRLGDVLTYEANRRIDK